MEPVIQLEGLCKSYGEHRVLNDINLTVYPGEVIGYIGPNGAGKSTTVKILCGLIPDFEGRVTVKGLDLRKDTLAVKKIIGYVPELAELYESLTANEFLDLIAGLYEIPADIADQRITSMLAAFDLAAVANDRIDTYSKGMRQKALLISGLLNNPDILILDEPLSGLDANSVIIVKELISRLAAEGKTIFYSSHMMDVVEKVSHRIILLNGGKLIADGSFAELQGQIGKESLETIFASLTANTGLHDAAAALAGALNQSPTNGTE